MNDKSQAIPLHGGQLRQISERFDIPVSQLIDFSVNINPDGPPAAVLSKLRASLNDISMLMSYPDLEQTELKQSIAEYSAVPPQNLVVANGFVPLLESALRTLQIKRCLLPVPAFVEYRRSLERVGVEIEAHALTQESDFRFDLAAFVDGAHDAILLANPQNPSGILTNRDSLRRLLSSCVDKEIAVLVDEAFIDYAPMESMAEDVLRFTNMVVFRSVTKFHAIPGLRVAYAAASERVAQAMHESLPPWPITTLASCAVASALQDKLYAEQSRILNNRRRCELMKGFAALGIGCYPSSANFLLIRLPVGVSSSRIWRHMIVEHQIVLRDCSNYEGLASGYLRVAVRTEPENQHLLNAISSTLQTEMQTLEWK